MFCRKKERVYSRLPLGRMILTDRSRCEREGQHCHLQGEVRTRPDQKQKETRQMAATQRSPHTLLLTRPQRVTRNPTPVEKQPTWARRGRRRQDHMAKALIRSGGRSTRRGMAPRPPSAPPRISCATWASSWWGSRSQVCILFREPPGKRENALQQSRYQGSYTFWPMDFQDFNPPVTFGVNLTPFNVWRL